MYAFTKRTFLWKECSDVWVCSQAFWSCRSKFPVGNSMRRSLQRKNDDEDDYDISNLNLPSAVYLLISKAIVPEQIPEKLIQMKYNKIKNPQWCEGRRIGYVHASMAEVLNSGARRSNSSLCEGLELATALATQSSAGYTPCCVGRSQSGAELQWETLLSRAASLLALDSIVTLQSSSPHSMMENRHFLVTGIRSKVSSFCWRSPFTSVSRRSLRRVNNPLNNGLDRIAGDYLF